MRAVVWSALAALVACGSSSEPPTLVAGATGGAGVGGSPQGGTGASGGAAGQGSQAGTGGQGAAGATAGQAGGAGEPVGGAGGSSQGGSSGATEGGGAGEGGASGGVGGSGAAGVASICKSFWTKRAVSVDYGKPMWRDAWGFHVFAEFGGSTAKDRFSLLSLSADTGETLSERAYDVIPKQVGSSFVSVEDVATDGNGHFAALFGWRYDLSDETRTTIVFGSVDSDAFSTVETPAGVGFIPHTVSWTGTGFLVQMVPYAGDASHLYEYSTAGQLLHPPTLLPVAMNIDWLQGEKRVEPTTHEIWMASSTYPSPKVWGIHPDSSPFPQPTPSSFFTVDRSPCLDGSGYISVAPTPTHALLSWAPGSHLCLQEVGLDMKSNHPALPLQVKQKPFGPFFYTRSTAQRRGDSWWVAALEQRGLRSLWVKDWEEVSNEPLVTHAPAEDPCLEDKSCSLLEYALDIRMLTPIVWGDELWLGYEHAGPIPKEKHSALRFVRVAPGCVYPSFEE